MSGHANSAIHFGPAFGFETDGVLALPGRIVERAETIITNNGRASCRGQYLRTAVLIGFVSELFAVFVALGW